MRVRVMMLIWLAWTLCMLMGCAAGISKQSRSQVTYLGAFADLQQNSRDLIGEIVLLGGKIIATQNREGTTELTILHLPLNNSDRPKDTDRSEGRFLVIADRFLDPAVYTRGHWITVVGELVSSEKRLIGELEYLYPKIKAQEIKLWEPTEIIGPRIRFGIGIGANF